MSEKQKYALAAVLLVGFTVWFINSQSSPKKSSSQPTATQPARESACDIERRAVEPLLPRLGETFIGKYQFYTPSIGSGNHIGTVTEVETKCFSNGFGVLVHLRDWSFQNSPNPHPGRTARTIVEEWVTALVAEEHNPRTLKQNLFLTAIVHHGTSPTGVKHYAKVERAHYGADSDAVSSYEARLDRGSKKVPSDFW